MTGFGTVETAIEAMKKGAYDYILKPFKVEEVIHVVKRALHRQQLAGREHPPARGADHLPGVRGHRARARARPHPRRDPATRRSTRPRPTSPRCTCATRAPACYEERIKPARRRRHRRIRRRAHPGVHRADRASSERRLGDHRARPKAPRASSASAGAAGRVVSSYVAVPLQVAGKVIGALNVFSFHAGQEVRRGPPQDARGAGLARGHRDRQRAAVRRPAPAQRSS
jgi:hypothetical protein